MTEPATGGSQRGPAVERQDLEAVLAVRQELGADYEPALVDSFVEKIETAIEQRVDARVAALNRSEQAERHHHGQQLALGIVSLGTGIPITAVAGAMGDGLPGVLVAWAGIAAVNFAYALQGRKRA